jgi:hypothetical protein
VASNAVRPTDLALQTALECALEEHFGSPQPVSRMTRSPSEYGSSFALEHVDLEFSGRDPLRVVFKDVSPAALSAAGRAAKPTFLMDPTREILVYRMILGPFGVGAPTCFGSVVDPARHRYWLFLEAAPGAELYQVGEIQVWQQVARWLAVTHATLAPHASRLALDCPLLRYDRDYYETWARRVAATSTSRGEGAATARLQAWLRAWHPSLVGRLVDLPHTVIHGEFYAANVLVQADRTPPAVRAVDWEMAAVGPGLIDLGALTSGAWSEQDRTAIARAYWEEATSMEGEPDWRWPSFERFLQWMQLCRLHLAIQWLSWSASWTPPAHQSHDWLQEALLLIEEVQLG